MGIIIIINSLKKLIDELNNMIIIVKIFIHIDIIQICYIIMIHMNIMLTNIIRQIKWNY